MLTGHVVTIKALHYCAASGGFVNVVDAVSERILRLSSTSSNSNSPPLSSSPVNGSPSSYSDSPPSPITQSLMISKLHLINRNLVPWVCWN
uniref:Uncharacterized protein n=1 Tax=Chenopodium quinoa TaxID=63459 RepID=A0A803MA86_CHEQI